jgi:hypothetical protein
MSQRCAERQAKYYGTGKVDNKMKEPAMKPNAFKGEIIARTGLLLGGVKVHQCHPFVEWRDCVRWTDQCIETNKEAGRDPMFNGIHMVYCENPIESSEKEEC